MILFHILTCVFHPFFGCIHIHCLRFLLSGFSQKRPPNEVLRNKGGRVITLYGKSFTSYFNAVFLLLLHVPAAIFKAAETVQSCFSFTFFHSLLSFLFSAEMVIACPTVSFRRGHQSSVTATSSSASSFNLQVLCNLKRATCNFFLSLHCQLITDH